MFDGKFIVTLISLVVAVIAICNFNTKNLIKEGYGMLPSKTRKFDRIAKTVTQSDMKGQFYSVPGTYQAMLSPRVPPMGGYGAAINYKMPPIEHRAVPDTPITFSKMATKNYNNSSDNTGENYSSDSCPQTDKSKKFHGGDNLMPSGFTSGNYQDEVDKARSKSTPEYPTVTDMLTVGDMTDVNSLGEPAQTIIYDRIMYANRNNRTRGLGDPIRGDLAIVPCKADWFRPSAHPGVDLQPGAMNILAGPNESTRALNQLIMSTSNGNIDTIAGVDLSTANKSVSTTNGMADLTVNAYL